MTKREIFYAVLLLLLFTVGCGAPYASLDKSGLKYRDYAIEVKSISEYKPRFLESNWDIGNWMERTSDKSWHRKKLEIYKGAVYVDRYANGAPKKIKNYYSELVLDHDGSLSTITVDVTSASSTEWNMRIEDMYQVFVDNIAAKESWYAGKRFEKTAVDKQAQITRLNSQAFKIGKYDAIIGYLDRSEYDSDEANADMRFALFLMKITDMAGLNRTENLKGTKAEIPVVLSVVLESQPDYFNSLESDFYSVIRQIAVNGKQIEVDYVNPTVLNSPCDAEAAKVEGKKCPQVELKDISEEDVINPMPGKKKKKKQAPPKDKDDSGLF